MRTKQLFGIIITAAVVSGTSLTATAQQQTSQTAAPQKQQVKSTPTKTAKVWSDDDLSSLRSPADAYKEEKEAQTAQAAAAAKPAAPAKQGESPAWSKVWTIKTPDDAQKAIDWDNRDIAAQQQYADRLRNQLDTAPPDQRDHLQQTLNHELEVIATTVKERDGITAQQKQLEKKSAAGTNAPATPPQSQ